MDESPTPSRQYRKELATNLHALRQSGDKAAARVFLAREKEKPIYRLAEALRRETQQSRFYRAVHDESSNAKELFWGTSNEPSLYEAFPYIRHCTGVGVGVGLDQMLDVAVNSKLDKVVMFDVSHQTSLTSRAFLEVGRRYHELNGRYPRASEFPTLFERGHLPITLEMIRGQFEANEQVLIKKVLYEQVKVAGEELPDRSLRVYEYLSLKGRQREFTSWLSKDVTLEHVIRMYEEGKIILARGDLAGTKAMKSLAKQLQDERQHISVVYLSNAEQSIGGGAHEDFTRNFEMLPVTDDTVLISTHLTSQFGTIPKPLYAVEETMGRAFFLSWAMDVRTVRDRRTQGELDKRESAVASGRKTLEEVGLVIPKTGLILSDDIVSRTDE